MTTAGYRHPRVFTVPPGAPFLEAVARALIDGELVEGFRHGGDPLVMADATIHVPTRRAVREMRSVFVDLLGGSSALLPRIRPLGEFDPADLIGLGDGAMFNLPPAVPARERQAFLAPLVWAWTKRIKQPVLDALFGDEAPDTPVSAADALRMASSLGELIDSLETETGGLAAIARAATADVSDWWQLTLAFLEIVRDAWPAYLAESGRLDAATVRDLVLARQGEALAAGAARGPVIIAGSTGSIPATAGLMRIVARLDKGAVVLPGYDTAQHAAVLEALDDPRADTASTIGHPQYGMRRTVRRIGVDDSAIASLGPAPSPSLRARAHWVSAALAPAETTDRWIDWRTEIDPSAHDGVAILHAANEGAEALAIACALREAILDDTRRAALVTPDRNLARRVAAELARFGIEADDSGGTPFATTVSGQLLFLVAGLAEPVVDAAHLIAVLRHPHVRLGAGADEHETAADLLELMVLRGSTGRIRPGRLAALAERCLSDWADDRRHKPAWFGRVVAGDFERVRALASALDSALAPLADAAAGGAQTNLAAMAIATTLALEALCRQEDGTTGDLFAGDAGNQLASLLQELSARRSELAFEAGQWPDVLRALTAGMIERLPPGGHPRIAIWGVLEARLQTVDLLVLGGLNEGVWPAIPRDDPFLNRAMKTEIGLALPERRIGLAAHDFQMAMGQETVLLTRALRADRAPTVASRWLQRLETLAGKEAVAQMGARGDRYARLADAMARPADLDPAPRPAPTPPLEARPKRLSVTEVETLVADPYAIYARRVLGLAPLDPLMRDPDVAERGSLYHAVFETAVKAGVDFAADDAKDRLTETARAVFAEAELPPEIDAVWWQRMEQALTGFLEWERARDGTIAARHAETVAHATEIGRTGVVLTGKADRIDIGRDGLAEIIDYKTGGVPSNKTVKAGHAPQLPLEAKLLSLGRFNGMGAHATGALTYVKIGPRGEFMPVHPLGKDAGSAAAVEAVAEKTWAQLTALVGRFQQPGTAYVSHFRPAKSGWGRREGDYDHLARLQEWSAGEDSEGGEA